MGTESHGKSEEGPRSSLCTLQVAKACLERLPFPTQVSSACAMLRFFTHSFSLCLAFPRTHRCLPLPLPLPRPPSHTSAPAYLGVCLTCLAYLHICTCTCSCPPAIPTSAVPTWSHHLLLACLPVLQTSKPTSRSHSSASKV